MSVDGPRQNFHKEIEAGINKQINLELYSSYFYLGLAYHFDRDDIALSGFHKYFKKLSDEERCDAEKLMQYQNMRGGRIVLQDVQKPAPEGWPNALETMQAAHQLAKATNKSLLELRELSDKQNDYDFGNFLEEKFLHKQTDLIKTMSDHITNLRRVGLGLGEYQFDKETME